MESAQSPFRSESIPVLSDNLSRRGALKGTRSRDGYMQMSITDAQPAHTERRHVQLSGEAQEDYAIAGIETHTLLLLHSGEVESTKTPEIDYRRATDQQLLTAARLGDKEAFAELSGRYVEMIHRKIVAIVRNQEDAEDIVQETLFKAYTHLTGFRGTSTFSTWLTRIAINSALMLLRRRRSRHEVSLDQPGDEDQTGAVGEIHDPCPDAEQICARRQTSELLSYALSRLPPRSRSIVEQYHVHEQSMKGAANSLGITQAAAKSRLLRARRVTRTILERRHISMANAGY